MELVFVAVYTCLWFGAGWLIGQNVLHAKIEKEEDDKEPIGHWRNGTAWIDSRGNTVVTLDIPKDQQ